MQFHSLLLRAAPLLLTALAGHAQERGPIAADSIPMKHFRPESIYHVPVTKVDKAAFALTDMHTHDYAENEAQVATWVKTMDSCNVAHSNILTYATGKSFDSLVARFSAFPNRFSMWCGIDFTDFDKPSGPAHAVAELIRCNKKGARGIGELGDKGEGEKYSRPFPGKNVHIDDARLDPFLEKCAELKMPISIHVAEDQWMYEKADSSNDGLMNAATWHVDMNKPGKLGHDELLQTLARAVKKHPKTTFIACHLANSNADLNVLGRMLDSFPNLYADIAARFGEFSPIPRFTAAFFIKYQDRLVYGTDMGMSSDMYRATFRILETADEHFYYPDQFSYHWALYGLNLPKEVLKKIYQTNAEKITQVH